MKEQIKNYIPIQEKSSVSFYLIKLKKSMKCLVINKIKNFMINYRISKLTMSCQEKKSKKISKDRFNT